MGLLRFFLAFAVVISHSDTIFGCDSVGGAIAVQAFYIISGFYMSLILNEKYVNQNGSYKLFITNRLLRLFPIYWVVLTLGILSSIFLGIRSHGANWAYLAPYVDHFHTMKADSIFLLFFSNIFIFGQDLVMFLGLGPDGHLFFNSNFATDALPLHKFLIIPAAWTLGVELLFYLVAPFVVKKRIKIIAGIIVCSLILRFILYYNGLDHDPWTYRFFPTELVFFMLGCVSYKMYRRIRTKKINPVYLNIIWIFIVLSTVFYSQINFVGKDLLYFICFFIALPFIFHHTKNMKVDSYIGELSYPIYISHLFVLGIIEVIRFSLPGGMGVTISLPVILFAVLLNELIAKKIEKRRQRRLLPVK